MFRMPWFSAVNRRDVTFQSIIQSASIEVVDKWPKGGRDLESIPCPAAIVEYCNCGVQQIYECCRSS